MKRFMTKKVVTISLVAGLLVGGTGVAFAILTLTGSGTGSGGTTAGTGGTAPVTLSVTFENPTANPLVPGATVPVDFDATNPNPNPVTITTISFVSVTSTNALCESLLSNYPQFSMAQVKTNTTVPAGVKDEGLVPSGALVWADLTSPPVDQTACLGQPLVLNVTTP
jgi:hypothetical protein